MLYVRCRKLGQVWEKCQLSFHEKNQVHMKITKPLRIRSVMKSVYNNSLWRLPWVFHVGQGKWPALFPKLSGRYSTTLHCTHSTSLWVQACGLDLGEWAHPIYIQAISNRSERHMHAHNCIDCLSRQQCSLPSSDKRKKEKQRQRKPPDTEEIYSHNRLFTLRQQS